MPAVGADGPEDSKQDQFIHNRRGAVKLAWSVTISRKMHILRAECRRMTQAGGRHRSGLPWNIGNPATRSSTKARRNYVTFSPRNKCAAGWRAAHRAGTNRHLPVQP